MADQARRTVVDLLEREKGEIEYFEEAFRKLFGYWNYIRGVLHV